MRGVLIIALAAVVLGAGVMLWRMTKDTSTVDAEPTPSKKTERVEAPVAKGSDEAASVTAVRDAKIPGAQARATQRPTASSSGGGPALPEAGSGSGSNSAYWTPARVIEQDLKRQLRKQLDAIDGPISDCVAKHGKGKDITGAAALTWKVVKGEKGLGAPEVAIEPVDTTIKNAALLGCLRDTGKKISIDFPEGVTEVWGTHQVNLDKGGVTGHDLTWYQFAPGGRPVDPPGSNPTP